MLCDRGALQQRDRDARQHDGGQGRAQPAVHDAQCVGSWQAHRNDIEEGPFSHLHGIWEFKALGEKACKISLDLTFDYAGPLVKATLGPLFNQAANTLVDAFASERNSSMDKSSIAVEVVYALADKQKLLQMTVPAGTTVREAALRSGLDAHFPGLDLASAPLGIFGKAVPKPEERVLEEGERVEIYRPLIADPKEVRKQRAAKAAKTRQRMLER